MSKTIPQQTLCFINPSFSIDFQAYFLSSGTFYWRCEQPIRKLRFSTVFLETWHLSLGNSCESAHRLTRSEPNSNRPLGASETAFVQRAGDAAADREVLEAEPAQRWFLVRRDGGRKPTSSSESLCKHYVA